MRSGLRQAFRNQASPPVPMSAGRIRHFGDLTSMRGDPAAMERVYGAMGTIYSCVQLRAESAARPQWHLYKKQPADARRRYAKTDTGSDQRTEVTKHAALSLLSAPNDFWSRFKLFEYDSTYQDLTGEYFWVLERAAAFGFPSAIWSVRPDRMEPVVDPGRYLVGWVYTSPDGESIPLGTDEVLQSALPNPLDPMRGLGPVQSVLVQAEAHKYSAEWNRNFFFNSATPEGVITIPGSLDDVEFKQFIDRWRETHRGVSRAHRVGVLEDGATWTPNQMAIRDMDFANLQNLSRDTVREAFRMPKVMLGVSDDVNRANAQTGMEVYAAWSTVPALDRKKDMINSQFLPMFGASGEGVEFDYTTPVPPNREEDRLEMVAKCQAWAALVDGGADPHDALEVVGLPDMDMAETATQAPAVPPNWVPAGPGITPPAPDDEALSNELVALVRAHWDRQALSNGHRKAGA